MALDDSLAGHCQLLDLPPELRLIIYEMLFTTAEMKFDITSTAVGATYAFVADAGLLPLPGTTLLRTCKAISAEAIPVFYEGLTFYLTIDGHKPRDIRSGSGHQEHYIYGRRSRGKRPRRRIWTLKSFSAFAHMRHAVVQPNLTYNLTENQAYVANRVSTLAR